MRRRVLCAASVWQQRKHRNEPRRCPRECGNGVGNLINETYRHYTGFLRFQGSDGRETRAETTHSVRVNWLAFHYECEPDGCFVVWRFCVCAVSYVRLEAY